MLKTVVSVPGYSMSSVMASRQPTVSHLSLSSVQLLHCSRLVTVSEKFPVSPLVPSEHALSLLSSHTPKSPGHSQCCPVAHMSHVCSDPFYLIVPSRVLLIIII